MIPRMWLDVMVAPRYVPEDMKCNDKVCKVNRDQQSVAHAVIKDCFHTSGTLLVRVTEQFLVYSTF